MEYVEMWIEIISRSNLNSKFKGLSVWRAFVRPEWMSKNHSVLYWKWRSYRFIEPRCFDSIRERGRKRKKLFSSSILIYFDKFVLCSVFAVCLCIVYLGICLCVLLFWWFGIELFLCHGWRYLFGHLMQYTWNTRPEIIHLFIHILYICIGSN